MSHKFVSCMCVCQKQSRVINVNFVVGGVPEHVRASCRVTDMKWLPFCHAGPEISNVVYSDDTD